MTRQVSVIARRVTVCALLVATSATLAATIAKNSPSSQSTLPKPDKPLGPSFYDAADPYDLAAIQRDPAGYYGRSVPSRVWQTVPLPPGQSRHQELLMLSPRFRFVAANGRRPVPLAVRAKPGRPVTFTALDQGHFANGQISLTIPADQDGYAKVDFWVGDAGDFRVLAGSPENHSPAEFTLQALPPAELKALEDGEYAAKYRAKLAKDPQANKLASHREK